MWWKSGHKYGRWEARVRSQAGNGYGPVMLLWPESGDWPEDGEIDIMEIPKGDRTKAHFTVHWGEDNEQRQPRPRPATSPSGTTSPSSGRRTTSSATWTASSSTATRTATRSRRARCTSCMQQDIGPYGTDWIPAPDASTPSEVSFEADWVRIYAS